MIKYIIELDNTDLKCCFIIDETVYLGVIKNDSESKKDKEVNEIFTRLFIANDSILRNHDKNEFIECVYVTKEEKELLVKVFQDNNFYRTIV